ncbi:MAG: hypothetical protein SGPRY_009677 [Prymnesium sp.]
MKSGDIVYLSPCSSKPDQFGEEHCTFPSVLLYDGTPFCAAGAIREIELEAPRRGLARRTAPLFADESGHPCPYYTLNDWLRRLLTALLGAQAAAAFSWHSFRIELACLLRAAGCPDSIIQLICHWRCPESVQKYAQVGTAQNINWMWITQAHRVQFDAVRTINMAALDNADAYAQLSEHAFSPVSTSSRALPAVCALEWTWNGTPSVTQSGVVTSRRQGFNSAGNDATVYNVLYDATPQYAAHASWHDLSEVSWRMPRSSRDAPAAIRQREFAFPPCTPGGASASFFLLSIF